jgi:ABC-type nitrate/sulfonate/bicarbonate transport system substrate-binding protein
MRGKRVGTYTRTSSHYHLYKALEANGLQESDVEIVGLALTTISPAT